VLGLLAGMLIGALTYRELGFAGLMMLGAGSFLTVFVARRDTGAREVLFGIMLSILSIVIASYPIYDLLREAYGKGGEKQ